jgi:dihydroorotase-like cyclic amidohydrolase
VTVDLVIANGRVVTPAGVIHGGLAIAGEKIVAIDADARLPAARRTIDARGQYVLPGLIDAHVHMASEEDASIGDGLRQNMPIETDGALHGGVTTFAHFVGAAQRATPAEHPHDDPRGQPLVARRLLPARDHEHRGPLR